MFGPCLWLWALLRLPVGPIPVALSWHTIIVGLIIMLFQCSGWVYGVVFQYWCSARAWQNFHSAILLWLK